MALNANNMNSKDIRDQLFCYFKLQITLLVQELQELVTKPNFTSVICNSFEKVESLFKVCWMICLLNIWYMVWNCICSEILFDIFTIHCLLCKQSSHFFCRRDAEVLKMYKSWCNFKGNCLYKMQTQTMPWDMCNHTCACPHMWKIPCRSKTITSANITVIRAITHVKKGLFCCNWNASDYFLLLSLLWFILFCPKLDVWNTSGIRNSVYWMQKFFITCTRLY